MKKEEHLYNVNYTSYPFSSLFSPSSFQFTNIASDSNPVSESIHLLPKFNPFLTYSSLLALFTATNLSIHQDVDVFLKRSVEVIRQAYYAELSYYRNSKQHGEAESFVQGVLQSQMEGSWKWNANANATYKNMNNHKFNKNNYGKKVPVKAASTPGTPRGKSPTPQEPASSHYSPPSRLPESITTTPTSTSSLPSLSSFNLSSLLIKPLKHLFTPSPPPLSSPSSFSSSRITTITTLTSSSPRHFTSLSLPSGNREPPQSSRFSSFLNRRRVVGSLSAALLLRCLQDPPPRTPLLHLIFNRIRQN